MQRWRGNVTFKMIPFKPLTDHGGQRSLCNYLLKTVLIASLGRNYHHWNTIGDPRFLLETPDSRYIPPCFHWGPHYCHWSTTNFNWRLHLFVGDPNIFIGDPEFFIADLRFSLEILIFSLETPPILIGDPHIFVGDPQNLVGDPHIFIEDPIGDPISSLVPPDSRWRPQILVGDPRFSL